MDRKSERNGRLEKGNFLPPGKLAGARRTLWGEVRIPMTTFAHQEVTDSQLANAINDAHEACRLSAQSAIEPARHAGDLLIEAKQALAHGEWLAWLQEHCPLLSVRVAQSYMRIAREWPRLEA